MRIAAEVRSLRHQLLPLRKNPVTIMVVCGSCGGENGLKTSQCFRVASAGSAERMLPRYVGIAQGRRGARLRVSLSAVPANAAAVEAAVTACHGWRRREVSW